MREIKKKNWHTLWLHVLASAFLFLGFAACDSTELGRDEVNDPPAAIPSDANLDPGNGNPNNGGNGNSSAQLGESCSSSDPNKICLALKYIAYEGAISESQILQNLDQINQIWSQCNIAFEIDQFESPDPRRYNLYFNTSSTSELSQIRRTFEDDSTLLVVTTGQWSGSLGSGAANAWTAMPGSGLYGAILEESVGGYANIIAHELGHYLNLGHVSDSSDVMNPVIYQSSTRLTTSQCNAARSASLYYWKAMRR